MTDNETKVKRGLREKIKSGEISPEDAFEIVKNSGKQISKDFVQWLKRTGRKRYNQALATTDAKTETDSESPTVAKKAKKKSTKKATKKAGKKSSDIKKE